MARSFTIPKQGYRGLKDLIDIGPDRLSRLGEEVADHELTLDVQSLGRALSRVIEFDEERVTRSLTTVLIPLSGMRATFRMGTDEFMKLLGRLIEKQNPEWYEANNPQWQVVAPAVGSLIAGKGFFELLDKVFRLLAERPAAAREFKILTDLRPVYDDEVTELKAMLLTSSLVIDYREGAVTKQLHLALGQSDLEALREQLDRADKKAHLLEEQASRFDVPVLVSGSE